MTTTLPRSGHAPVVLRDLQPPPEDLFHAVLHGLSARRRALPCKYLYDEAGSRLFDRICTLPEYYPTRLETAVLARHADEIAERVGPRARLVELGSGSASKIRILLERLAEPAAYVPIDISRGQLVEAALAIADAYPDLEVLPVCADYTGRLTLPVPAGPTRRTVAFFPGSTIGNFEPPEAEAFLYRLARLVGRGGGLLIGVDLEKDAHVLERAYDDAQGVTAAFNLNLLARINRECGADFDLDGFGHRAVYDAAESRIEMHLVSRRAQTVRIGGRATGWFAEFGFDAGESIVTEHSYKYTLRRFGRLAERAGFAVDGVWTDPDGWFSVHYLRAAGPITG